VQNTVRQVGGALGVAVVGTVLATQYAANLSASRTEIPDAAGQALPDEAFAAASESIVATQGVLVSAAESGVPEAILSPLRDAAFADFLAASHVTSIISAVVVIIAALIVGFGLPHITVPTKGGPHVQPGGESQGQVGEATIPIDERIENQVEHYAEELSEELEQPERG
jgi:hypothetical protein